MRDKIFVLALGCLLLTIYTCNIRQILDIQPPPPRPPGQPLPGDEIDFGDTIGFKGRRTEEITRPIDLQKMPLDHRLKLAAWNLDINRCAAIAYAKSKGENAENLGMFTGQLSALRWKRVRGRGPRYLIREMYRNLQSYNNIQIEVLDESDTTITVRINRAWAIHFSDGKLLGITLEEYEDWMKNECGVIAVYLGLVWEQNADGGWIVITVKEKE